MDLRRGSISRGLHPTLMVPALEAAKVGNARQWSSYERQKHHRPRRSRIHCVHEFVVRTPFRCQLRLLDFRRALVQANWQCVALSTWDEHGQGPRVADDRSERYRGLDSAPFIN